MAASTTFTTACIIFCVLIGANVEAEEETRPPHIAIVGGGIGGTSAAYFMRELFGSDAVIDLYEKNTIGGRLATVNINSREYESGGSIIHPENLYMVNFTKILGLEKREKNSGAIMGIFDGEELRLTTSPYSVVTLAKMFWHYGMDIYNLQTWVSNILVKFKRIYTTQDAGYAYTNVPELLASMDPSFANYLKKSVIKVMREEGFHDALIYELVLGAMRTNYGQGVEIPGFVGAISMAGVDSGLWAVKGGNKMVPENIVKHSKINVIAAEVKMVEFLEDEPFLYEVYYRKDNNNEAKSKRYDMVVIATPLHDEISDIKFEGFQQDIHNFPQKYHKTVATFVHGRVNSSYFGVEQPADMPNEVFTCNMDLLLNSFGQHLPVDYNSASDTVPPIDSNIVGKLFSNRELTQEEVKLYFESIEEVHTVSWMAYPEYNFKKIDDLPPFLLNERLYYVNAIELAASAMEMEAIAGRNIALLAYNHWHDNLDKIDEKYVDPAHATSPETGDL
ncbi:prenylcysteine oxidase 1-like [Mizuhopecten yessoensis]|uniref:prenylcysteine oxidase 1-like n=1 Tax=Mizuhopecten yessoensis TaxID=6573 RepID=UPI000B457A72|nr:prenylcysteine oxidase 1-like [Mizuhopecten yessoensis]